MSGVDSSLHFVYSEWGESLLFFTRSLPPRTSFFLKKTKLLESHSLLPLSPELFFYSAAGHLGSAVMRSRTGTSSPFRPRSAVRARKMAPSSGT